MITPAEIKRLRRAREAAHVSMAKIARAAHVDRKTIFNFEHGLVTRKGVIDRIVQSYSCGGNAEADDEWIERQVSVFLRENADSRKTSDGRMVMALTQPKIYELCRIMLIRAEVDEDERVRPGAKREYWTAKDNPENKDYNLAEMNLSGLVTKRKLLLKEKLGKKAPLKSNNDNDIYLT